jgi:hypothetical protein
MTGKSKRVPSVMASIVGRRYLNHAGPENQEHAQKEGDNRRSDNLRTLDRWRAKRDIV